MAFEIGPRENEHTSAGMGTVYSQEWTREINGETYWFTYHILTGTAGVVRVFKLDGELVHEFREQVSQLPGLAVVSQQLGSFLGL